MSIIFFDEIGVEPVAFTGKEIKTQIYVPNAIHKLYSGKKVNITVVYNTSRYIYMKRENRFINMPADNRFIETSNKENC